MPDCETFQIHANANIDRGDCALRVTVTSFDRNGHQVATHTYRKHVKALYFDSDVWQAYSAVTDLARMMAYYANTEIPTDLEPDQEPLF